MKRDAVEALVAHLDGRNLGPILRERLEAVKADLDHDKRCEAAAARSSENPYRQAIA